MTRITFPDAITDWQGDGNFTQDPTRDGAILISIKTGDKTLAVKAMRDTAMAVLTVVCRGKTYKFKLVADPDPVHAVTFYPAG